MATKAEIRPSDLETRTYRLADGTTVRKKVIQSNSPTLAEDILAAFRSSVRSIRAEQRKRARALPAAE
nr:hypothetical protein [Polymorphobacter sp.]